MCLIAFAWQAYPDYPLILAANRDGYFTRAARPLRCKARMTPKCDQPRAAPEPRARPIRGMEFLLVRHGGSV